MRTMYLLVAATGVVVALAGCRNLALDSRALRRPVPQVEAPPPAPAPEAPQRVEAPPPPKAPPPAPTWQMRTTPTTPPAVIPPVAPPVGTDWQDTTGPLKDPTPDALTVLDNQRWGPVYFAYDSSTIGAVEQEKVEKLADFLRDQAALSTQIEGHCDERGSDEYNRALGERRALAVKDLLVKLGIDEKRLSTISYGEERPADPAHTEAAYQRNRRAEFVIIRQR